MAEKIEPTQKINASLGMSEIPSASLDQKMAQWFLRFAEQASGSPMYQYLSKLVSGDSELLALAGYADSKQPAPNLFFGAVHFILMQNPKEGLANYYPSLGGRFAPTAEMFDCFKYFCRKFDSEIRGSLSTKLVQTNEVQRCALLFPAVNLISQKMGLSKITLIDVGASGGLNLLLDQAHIRYSGGTESGPVNSPLQIQCESRGHKVPTFQPAQITQRIGIDLNPVNLLNETERLWNLALVWPDQVERAERVKTALQILKHTSIDLRRGSANQVLTKVISEVSQEQVICIMHSFTLNQFSKEDRAAFELVLVEASQRRDIWRISLEWIGTQNPELSIMKYCEGKMEWVQKIAECGGHGEWIQWLDENVESINLKSKLSEVIMLRKSNRGEEALAILNDLLRLHSDDPEVNYQMAWTCDFMGKESEAAPFYERALENGLVNDRNGAFLGLGSTYRCLGEYEKSLKTFDQAISEFPNERALKVFRSLTLFNLNRIEESVGDLLIQLLDTTTDASIKSYDSALRFYSDKLKQTW